jgi:hypothetical protein
MTLVANEPLLLPRMDTKIALADLASGMAVLIRAEYGCGVHDGSSWLCVENIATRSMSGPPFALQLHRTTIWCGATIIEEAHEKPGFCRNFYLRRFAVSSSSLSNRAS